MVVADNSSVPADSRAPIAVVLDSNPMWRQWRLAGRSWEYVREQVEKQRIAFYVPEVVVQEVVRGHRTDANELVRGLDDLNLPRINRLLQLNLPNDRRELENLVEDVVADYDTELRDRLKALGAEIIQVPTTSHQEILTRAMLRRPPFDKDGRDGYRDALIWYSLLDVAKRDHAGVVFVTNNTSDFCMGKSRKGKPPVLHPELVKDLAEVSATAVAVLATNVNEIGARVDEVECRIAQTTAGDEVATDGRQPGQGAQLSTKEGLPAFKKPGDDDVQAALVRCIDTIVAGVDAPNPGWWGSDLEDGWQFRSILEDEQLRVVSIDPEWWTLEFTTEGTDWAEFTATVDAVVTMDGFAFKADVYVEDQISFDIQDSDWNDHYMHVLEYHEARLEFRLLLNDNGAAIQECWLEDAMEKPSVNAHAPESGGSSDESAS